MYITKDHCKEWGNMFADNPWSQDKVPVTAMCLVNKYQQ